jgi:hypothetical protein
LDGIDLTVIALTLATAAIHVSRALANSHIAALFTLNAIGYVVLLGLLYLPTPLLGQTRLAARWTLVGYATVTFVLYFIWGMMKAEWLVPVGPADKVIEVVLIALLLVQAQRERPVQMKSYRRFSRKSSAHRVLKRREPG